MAVLGTSAAAEQSALTPFTARYTISNDQYSVGTASLSLAREGAYWLIILQTEPSGLFSLFSRGNTRESSLVSVVKSDPPQASRLTPVHYTFFQEQAKPGRNLSVDFKPSAGQITIGSDAEDSKSVIASTGMVYDPLSSMLYIMRQLAAGNYSTLELALFSRARVTRSTFTFTPVETVHTSLGNHAAVRVIRKREDGERETHVWYAEALNFVPVKIEQYKRSELVARLSLDSIGQ